MTGSGHGTAARLVAARELRRRARALVALGVIVGLAAAVALAAFAGARRTDTSYRRLLDATNAADAVVFASTQGLFAPDYSAFDELPYVEAAGSFSIVGFPEDAGLFVPSGDWLDGVDRPRLLEGRLPDRSDPHEVVLSKPTSDELDRGLGVGDEFTVHPFPSQQLPPGTEGPTITLEIVGLTSSPFEISTIAGAAGSFYGTPAFLQTYGDQIDVFFNLMVKLRGGAADIPRLQADTNRILGRPVPVEDLSENVKRVTNGTDLERTGLLLFGAAIAVAGLVIVGQALIRSVRAAGADVPTLRALGFGRTDVVVALAWPHLVVVAVAAVVAAAGAIAISPLFPIGLGRRVEPDLGLHADWLVLLPGVALLVVLLVTAIVVTAARVSPSGAPVRPHPSAIVQTLAQVGLPVVPRIGAALALEGGHGRRALPTRPAALGAIVGVVGVVGALTLANGITDAVTNAGRFGTTWDIQVEPASEDVAPVRAAAAVMTDDDDFEAVGLATQGYLTLGEVVLPTFSIEALSGTIDFTVYEGRAPRTDEEIALGPAIASSQGIEIGDTISIGDGVEVEMVGLGLVPQTPHSSFDQGAWLHPDGAERLFEQSYEIAFGRLRGGADVQGEVAELAAAAGAEVTVITPDPPADQVNLRGVRTLPTLFAVFTVVLALGALAHVSVSVLRRRRGELAVLRSVGFTPRQTWWCLSCQASTLAVIGLAVGVPIGVAIGRSAWRSVADATPLIYVAPTAVLALALAVPVAVLLANLVAALPGLRAARLKPAEVLRSE